MEDCILKDLTGTLASSKRWPFLIDPSSQASVFFRYCDSNFVNALSPRDMALNTLRRSLLGAIRYGKPLVIDLGGLVGWEVV